MKDLSTKQKWAYMELHKEKLRGLRKRDSGAGAKTPAHFVAQLPSLSDDLLCEVYVCLNTEPLEWMEEFTAEDGVHVVLSLISSLVQRRVPNDQVVQNGIGGLLLIIAALLVTNHGKEVIFLKTRDALSRLVLCLDPRSVCAKCRMLLYDHLSFICYSDSRYYPNIVDSLRYYKFATREKALYSDLVQVVRSDPVEGARVCCLRFINALINTPDDIDDRMRMRVSFLSLGLTNALQMLPPMGSTGFNREIGIFQSDMELDSQNWLSDFGAESWYPSAPDQDTPSVRADDDVVRALVEYVACLKKQLALAYEDIEILQDTLGASATSGQSTPRVPPLTLGDASAQPPNPPPPPPVGSHAPVWIAPVPIPSRPMKVWNWSKIPFHSVRGTIWDTVKDVIGTSSVTARVSFSQLEDSFYSPTPLSTSYFSAHAASRKVSLLSTQRSQKIEIFLRSLHLSANVNTIVNAIVEVDLAILSLERVKQLLELLPTRDEITMLQGFCEGKGACAALAPPDEFLLRLHGIPEVSSRLAVIFNALFISECVERCSPEVTTLCCAMDQIRSSRRWPVFLATAMTVGNFVNGRSVARGNAAGIHLSSLLLMRDTKASTVAAARNSPSLLDFVLNCLDEDVLMMAEDMPEVVGGASSLSLHHILEESSQAHAAGLALDKAATHISAEDVLFEKFSSDRLVSLREAADLLYSEAQECDGAWRALAQFHGEDPNQITTIEFFSTIASLLADIQRFRMARRDLATNSEGTLSRASLATKRDNLKHDAEHVMDSMRHGELAEMRRTLRKNNRPTIGGAAMKGK